MTCTNKTHPRPERLQQDLDPLGDPFGGGRPGAWRLRLRSPWMAPTPYMFFAGTARDALSFYAQVFGGAALLHSFAEFDRTDGPGDAIAHGSLVDGPVSLFAADVAGDQPAFSAQGVMMSLLGTADSATLRSWFAALADGGVILDDLQERPWGAFDGQVIDRFGVHWLIGFENDTGD
jgi:PhnB protein